ncbi:MAG: amidase [Caldisphaeraceae archaeon]|nr:amidase [Caldisphaeraceae archaeon]MEB3692215.1 amidase [Caldisphaeraceae archaeon]MEB3797655.1 amidase [Caldisphaeraceae archaeon]
MSGIRSVERVFSNEIKELNNKINAFVSFNEKAIEEAEKVEKNGMEPIPIGIKDIIYTKGLKTTMGSRVFINFIPQRDSYIVKRLKRLGYVIVGKTNTHEFASGITTTSSVFGPTRNPIDLNRIAGGSSGGSAASASASIVPIAIGTDTAGSTRVPASLCGIYGYKPSYGKISIDGIFPLAPSFDTVGFLSKELKWIIRIAKEFDLYKEDEVKRIKLGIPRWYMPAEATWPEYQSIIEKVRSSFLDFISTKSIDYKEVDMPLTSKYLWRYFSAIRYSEGTYVHIKYKEKWDLYFPDVRRLVEKGLNYSAIDYIEAVYKRREVFDEFKKVLKDVDALITPTTLIYAPTINEVLGKEDGTVRSVLTYETLFASFVDAPSISIPSLTIDGMPVGIQIIGGKGEDSKVLNIAKVLSA